MVDNVILHLERLRRHYDVSMRSGDHVALLDLSHTLRIWTELKIPLREIAPDFSRAPLFKSSIPSKIVLREASDSVYMFAYMPGRVITYASNGNLMLVPPTQIPNGNFTAGMKVKRNSDGSIEMANFYYFEKEANEVLSNAVVKETTKRCAFTEWLGADAVRLCYPTNDGLKKMAISREALIKRVANTLDGSHPSSGVNEDDRENRYDDAIQYMLQFQIGGLPSPYFILLKIAQDILEHREKIIRSLPRRPFYV